VKAKQETRQKLKLVQHCNGITEFKQVDNKASKYALRKRILSRCHESCVGTEIYSQFGRHIVRLVMVGGTRG